MSQGRSPSGFSRQRSSVSGELISAAMFLVALLGVVGWIVRAYVLPSKQYVSTTTATSPIVDVQMATSRPSFTGTVVDAQTHKNVDEFAVMVGYGNGADKPSIAYPQAWGRWVFSGGQYTLSGAMRAGADAELFVRVEARGYLPAVSAVQAGSGRVNFQLTPGKDIVGHVFGIDGRPAAKVSVAATISGSRCVWMLEGKLNVQCGIEAVSEWDGRYDLPPQTGQFLIVACSQDGYVQVNQDEIAKSADIHLLPWGGVQGRVMVAGKPEGGRTITISSEGDLRLGPCVYADSTAVTDADGRFAVGRIRPGPVIISRFFPLQVGPQNSTSGGYTMTTHATVKAGETTTVVLDGGG